MADKALNGNVAEGKDAKETKEIVPIHDANAIKDRSKDKGFKSPPISYFALYRYERCLR